ncbi:MAG: hypothetical protein G01um101418_508 [Parcubacteria group bacterium Gr01-1014_18]|nr:MAG: hypothetical protein Greene041636_554 [Parcubacteria group bacterium Greene0416_36]TSC80971.1 MAG: hypothetical protein G01um101418_508 [Parcubacteria group bacterium Gr01-1014_18]TSC98858.1 MAG: hypothetical protein Greene101420_491 [Parcubacteria group bacterium Greene1014_20]TSD06556.1 MAG: hypothetical protein Greene07142_831 [Parcubacteria group bacterium Greene0714_2]
MKFYFLSFILLLSLFVLTAAPADAVSDLEARKTYRDILDRDPSVAELKAARPLKGTGDLRNSLNEKPEREKVLADVYIKALNREPRKDEIATLKNFRASVSKVKDQLFGSRERKKTIEGTYKNLLGRDPSASDTEFFIRTRADVAKIKETVGQSQERQILVEKKSRDLEFSNNNGKGLVADPAEPLPPKPLVSPDMSRGVIPCQIEGGPGFPRIGLCRFEFVPRTHFGALESTLGGDVNSFDSKLVPKILVIHIKEFSGAKAIQGEIKTLTPERSRELLPLPVDEKLSAIDEQLRLQLQEIRAKKESLFQRRRSLELKRKEQEIRLGELRTKLLALRVSALGSPDLAGVEAEFQKLEGELAEVQGAEQSLLLQEKSAQEAERKLLESGPAKI